MIIAERVREYFALELNALAQKRRELIESKVDIAQEDIDYLVNMMVRFVKADEFKLGLTNTPLLDLAQKKARPQIGELQNLADFCLFRTGFFPFGFNRRHLPPRKNFIVAGKKAYRDLSVMAHSAIIFLSLDANFMTFANLISELKLQYSTDKDVLELWGFWQETGNFFAEEQLRKMNIVPMHLKIM